jgi:HKD family nuclease
MKGSNKYMKIIGPNPASAELEVIGDEIRKSLDSAPKQTIFCATVGYISDSGMKRLKASLKKIIAQGGTVEVIVGLNQVSKRSLAALATLYNICSGIGVFVFWNPNINVTFHPKCYLLKPPKSGAIYVWIGSSNFTKQGLFSNYECNLHFVLDPKRDQSLISQIEDYYSKIRNSPYCHALDQGRLKRLATVRGIPSGEKPISTSPKINEQIKKIFGLKHRVTLPKNAFIMTLSKNDIAGKRWEPYFLIPMAAMQAAPSFWDWPLTEMTKSKYPKKDINAEISVGQRKTIENRRIYYVDGRKELRFVSPTIYKLGLSFSGSIVLIHKKNHKYHIDVVEKHDQRFAILLKYATQVASSQKLWGYK